MTPEVWLKSTQMVKVRNKLPTWSRQDILNLSEAEFNKIDLSKLELARLISLLKDPKCIKPVISRELKLIEADTEQETKLELRSNPVNNSDRTQWFWASGRFGLKFANPKDLTEWALGLILKDQTRANWNKLVYEWKEVCSFKTFTAELFPKATIERDAEKVFSKKTKEEERLRIPLPDNSTIRKRYWSLEEGDSLYKIDGHRMIRASVVQTRVNMDGPPSVTVEIRDDK